MIHPKSHFSFVALAVVMVVSMTLSGYAARPSPVSYTIKVDPSDLDGIAVTMRIPNAKQTLRVAMAAHPEYDDRYYRYIADFRAEADDRKLAVSKPEDAVWQIEGAAGEVTVRYRLNLPANPRSYRDAWKPFLTPAGGMVGDLHSLMYIVGEEGRPARLTLDMPAGWKAVSGLEPTGDPRVFTGSTELILDSPVMIGNIETRSFSTAGVPHTMAVWSPNDAKPTDTRPIFEGLKRLTEEAVKAFGKPPYPRYTFLIQNGGLAALEHATSLNVGLTPDSGEFFQEIAHEYVHVWNLMDVRPRERIGLRYRFAEPTGILWFSEGATIMFADLLLRRAAIPGDGRARIQRLESLIARYFYAPAYSTLTAEQISRGDSHPELLGDNWASTHLQGEVLSTMLDIKIRYATNGRRKLDDVLKTLAARFDSKRGVTNRDIETAISDTCRCEIAGFFRDHIYGARKIEFDHYLGLIGLSSNVTWGPAVGGDGNPVVDLRISPVSPEGELRLRITHPHSAWARAGIRTGDRLVSADDKHIANWEEFRNWLRTLRVNDHPRVTITRNGVAITIEVDLMPYEVPTARISEVKDSDAKSVRLRREWTNSDLP